MKQRRKYTDTRTAKGPYRGTVTTWTELWVDGKLAYGHTADVVIRRPEMARRVLEGVD